MVGSTARVQPTHPIVRPSSWLPPAGLLGPFAFEGRDAYQSRLRRPDLNRPWEYRLTLGTQWSFKPGDRLKSASEVLCELLRVAGRGGNMLLNVGPQPDGRIEPRQAAILLQIGAWLDEHGESVYRTRPGPYPPAEGYVSTRRDRVVYLHLLEHPDGPIDLPAYGRRLVSSGLMTGGGGITAEENDDRIKLSVDVERGNLLPWTVRLEFDLPVPQRELR